MTEPATERRPLPPFPTSVKAVLWVQVVLALGWGGIAMLSAGSAGEWADLVRVVGAMLVVAYLTGIGIAALLGKFVLRSPSFRIAALVLLPPLATWLFILVARA
ncbi:MAG: hypothetical protein R6X29_10160 [Acidimicrobiia bacterium]